MSYHGLGLTFSQTVPDGIAPIKQPAAPISPMLQMNINPLMPPGEYASGEQAMMLEMQSRASGDPAVFQPASLPQTITQKEVTADVPSMFVGPRGDGTISSTVIGTSVLTKDQLYEALIKYWKSILAGQQPGSDLEKMMTYARDSGQGYLSDQAENFVMSGGGQDRGVIPATTISVTQPSRNVVASIQIPSAGMPSLPITGIVATVNSRFNYSLETGLNPAQPREPVPPPPPPASQCPSGYSWVQGSAWVGCLDANGNKLPGNDANDTGPILPPPSPPSDYIENTTTTGQIPMGPDATAEVPQGQLPPKTEQYVVTPPPSGYQQGQGYTPLAQQKKTNYLPIIAIAVGAFLLLKMK